MDAVGRRYRIDAVIANEKERATSSFSGSAAIGQLADDGTSCSPITRSSREEINPTQPLRPRRKFGHVMRFHIQVDRLRPSSLSLREPLDADLCVTRHNRSGLEVHVSPEALSDEAVRLRRREFRQDALVAAAHQVGTGAGEGITGIEPAPELSQPTTTKGPRELDFTRTGGKACSDITHILGLLTQLELVYWSELLPLSGTGRPAGLRSPVSDPEPSVDAVFGDGPRRGGNVRRSYNE